MCLLAFDFLDELSLGLELFTLDFELVEQLLTLSLLFLYLVSGTFELTGQEGHVAFVVVIGIFLLINLSQTLYELISLVLVA